MESFFLGETLKYLYLLFEDDFSICPLDKVGRWLHNLFIILFLVTALAEVLPTAFDSYAWFLAIRLCSILRHIPCRFSVCHKEWVIKVGYLLSPCVLSTKENAGVGGRERGRERQSWEEREILRPAFKSRNCNVYIKEFCALKRFRFHRA